MGIGFASFNEPECNDWNKPQSVKEVKQKTKEQREAAIKRLLVVASARRHIMPTIKG